jgi:hypothetical protein
MHISIICNFKLDGEHMLVLHIKGTLSSSVTLHPTLFVNFVMYTSKHFPNILPVGVLQNFLFLVNFLMFIF